MKTKKLLFLRLIGFVGLGATILVILGLALALVSDTTNSASAKDKPKEKDAARTLKVVSITSPATFQGTDPYPIKALPGERLLAVTIDFDRDFKNHLRSSEAGEVNLKDRSSSRTYFTVATGLVPSDGPGTKPSSQATFVFSIPQTTGQLTLFYGQVQVDLGNS